MGSTKNVFAANNKNDYFRQMKNMVKNIDE